MKNRSSRRHVLPINASIDASSSALPYDFPKALRTRGSWDSGEISTLKLIEGIGHLPHEVGRGGVKKFDRQLVPDPVFFHRLQKGLGIPVPGLEEIADDHDRRPGVPRDIPDVLRQAFRGPEGRALPLAQIV